MKRPRNILCSTHPSNAKYVLLPTLSFSLDGITRRESAHIELSRSPAGCEELTDFDNIYLTDNALLQEAPLTDGFDWILDTHCFPP